MMLKKEMDYPCLYTVLQGYSTVVHCTESTWVVEADSIEDLFQSLKQCLTEGGRLLVVELAVGDDNYRKLNLING